MKHHSARALTLILLAGLLPACGGGGGGTTNVSLADAPAPSGSIIVLGQDNALFFVSPSNSSVILDSKLVWGLEPGTTLLAISVRPATGQLYGKGNDGGLYIISTASGFAELATNFLATAGGTFLGMDFNPVADRIRFTTDAEANFRTNPSTNVNLLIADTALNPAGNVVAVSYTPASGGFTTLYGIDSVSTQLVMIGGLDGTPSPNGGVITNVGLLGVTPVVTTGPPFVGAGFDISGGGTAYAALPVSDGSGLVTGLYTVNLTTGAATLVGTLGAGGPIRSIAVAP